jgi:hypothetical protein
MVYGAHNTSAVAALSGVSALIAYPGWVDDLGIPDWSLRFLATRTILSGADGALDEARRLGVDYVVIGPRERYELEASDSFWGEHSTVGFEAGEYKIYVVPPSTADGSGTP